MITGPEGNVFFGLSTDTKPTYVEQVKGIQHPIKNATVFYEMNTGDIYMWDAENSLWIKQ